jgi:hypothetical protein
MPWPVPTAPEKIAAPKAAAAPAPAAVIQETPAQAVPIGQLEPRQEAQQQPATVAPKSVVERSADLAQAGLVLIETTSAKPSAAPIEVPQQPLGRKPKLAVVIPEEPLQIIETRKD